MVYPFDRTFLKVSCPRCQYEIEVLFRLAQLEDMVFCPGCKARIQFSDDNASGHKARRETHRALGNLRQELKSLNKTFTFTL